MPFLPISEGGERKKCRKKIGSDRKRHNNRQCPRIGLLRLFHFLRQRLKVARTRSKATSRAPALRQKPETSARAEGPVAKTGCGATSAQRRRTKHPRPAARRPLAWIYTSSHSPKFLGAS